MKMMKRTLLMAAAVLALAACSDDDGPDGPQLVTETVTFEDATLNTSGILTGEKLAEEVTGDTGTYKEYSGTFYLYVGDGFVPVLLFRSVGFFLHGRIHRVEQYQHGDALDSEISTASTPRAERRIPRSSPWATTIRTMLRRERREPCRR